MCATQTNWLGVCVSASLENTNCDAKDEETKWARERMCLIDWVRTRILSGWIGWRGKILWEDTHTQDRTMTTSSNLCLCLAQCHNRKCSKMEETAHTHTEREHTKLEGKRELRAFPFVFPSLSLSLPPPLCLCLCHLLPLSAHPPRPTVSVDSTHTHTQVLCNPHSLTHLVQSLRSHLCLSIGCLSRPSLNPLVCSTLSPAICLHGFVLGRGHGCVTK